MILARLNVIIAAMISTEVVRYIGETRQRTLRELKEEFDLAKQVIHGDGDSLLWRSFDQARQDLRKLSRPSLKLYDPKVTLKGDLIRIRGRHVVPTLVLRWDNRPGFTFSCWKQIRCCTLIENNEVAGVFFGSGNRYPLRYREPEILKDSFEISRVISGLITEGRESYSGFGENGRFIWDFSLNPNQKLDMGKILEKADGRQQIATSGAPSYKRLS